MADDPIVYVDLDVPGLTCDRCVETVTDALETVRGVSGAEVSLRGRSARVAAAPGVTDEALRAAVRFHGYDASVRARRNV